MTRPDDLLDKELSTNDTLTKIDDLLEQGRPDSAAVLVCTLPAGEGARAFMHLDTNQRNQLLSDAPLVVAAELVDKLPTELAAVQVDQLTPERAGQILAVLDSDVRVDVIGETDHAEQILAEMPADTADEVRRLVAYMPLSAGGLMVTEALTFNEHDTVGTVLTGLASLDDDDNPYQGQLPLVLDDQDRVVGYTPLSALLSARRLTPVGQVMKPATIVSPDTSIDQLLDLFDSLEHLSLPVCDEHGQTLGAVLRHAVDVAATERAESQSYRRQGLVGDELRSMPLAIRSRRRLAWLTANIGLNIIAASVISMYEATLAAVIALAVFLPMVSDMSGCSGNQAVAVSLRELALGLTRPVDALNVWLKEVSVGLINGSVLGVIIGLVAWAWKGNPVLGVVIGGALAINTLIAVSIGGVIPLVLKRLNQDPAVASGPLLTTITDMAGFFIVLSMATLLMPWLK